MPCSPSLCQTSSIDLITKILHADIDKDPGIFLRYDRLWTTIDPSLGDHYLVPSGDVEALSCALHSIYEEHGLLIPSIESRDAGGWGWIGSRGDADPKSRRGVERRLEELKEEMAAAAPIKKDSPSINVTSRGMRVPDSKVSGTRSAKPFTLSSKRTLAAQGVGASTTTAERMRLMRANNIFRPSPTRPQETKEATAAFDSGAQRRVVVAAGPCANIEQRTLAPLVEGEWIVIDVKGEDGWTEI